MHHQLLQLLTRGLAAFGAAGDRMRGVVVEERGGVVVVVVEERGAVAAEKREGAMTMATCGEREGLGCGGERGSWGCGDERKATTTVRNASFHLSWGRVPNDVSALLFST